MQYCNQLVRGGRETRAAGKALRSEAGRWGRGPRDTPGPACPTNRRRSSDTYARCVVWSSSGGEVKAPDWQETANDHRPVGQGRTGTGPNEVDQPLAGGSTWGRRCYVSATPVRTVQRWCCCMVTRFSGCRVDSPSAATPSAASPYAVASRIDPPAGPDRCEPAGPVTAPRHSQDQQGDPARWRRAGLRRTIVLTKRTEG